MSDEPMEQVLVRMPRDLHVALKAHAAANERTMAQTVRRAVRAYLAAPEEATINCTLHPTEET